MNSKTCDGSGYGLDLDLLAISYRLCVSVACQKVGYFGKR